MKKTTAPQKTNGAQHVKFIALLVFSLASLKGLAQTTTLTLKQSLELALSGNRSLRADSLGILETKYKNKELAGAFLPQVNYNMAAEFNPAVPSQMLPGSIAGKTANDLVPVKFGTNYSFRSGVEVQQNIYRKDLRIKIRAADLYTGISNTKYELSKEDLVYRVSASYYNLQATYEMVQSTRRDYQNIKEVLGVAKAQFEHGTLKKIDYQTLQINLANKESELDQYQTRYEEQLTYFNYLVGLPVDDKTAVISDYSQVSRLQIPEPGANGRMDVKLYQQLIESKMVDLKSTHAERLPAITSYFRLNMQSQFNNLSNAIDYRTTASTVGVSMSIPLFDGNRRKNRVRATQVQLEQLQLQSHQLIDQAKMELAKASKTFMNNKQQFSITKSNLDLAEKVFASRRSLYTEGVTTLIELLDAERDLSQARTNYTQAMIDVQKSWLDVHKANGTVLTKYINELM